MKRKIQILKKTEEKIKGGKKLNTESLRMHLGSHF